MQLCIPYSMDNKKVERKVKVNTCRLIEFLTTAEVPLDGIDKALEIAERFDIPMSDLVGCDTEVLDYYTTYMHLWYSLCEKAGVDEGCSDDLNIEEDEFDPVSDSTHLMVSSMEAYYKALKSVPKVERNDAWEYVAKAVGLELVPGKKLLKKLRA